MENVADANARPNEGFVDEEEGIEHYGGYVDMFARALDRLRQGEPTSNLVEEFEAVYRCFEERERDFHAAVEVGQMLVEKNKQLMEAAEQSAYTDESSQQVTVLKTRNKELHETIKEMEVKRDLFQQKYRALEEARDKLLEYVKELEEEQRNNRLEIKANANAKRENRRLLKKLEQYKEEIQELMEKHEKMQKQNSQLRNDLMLLKDKNFSPEDRKLLQDQIAELEKENKDLKTTKEALAKLKEVCAKLEIENAQLRGLSDQNASLKTAVDNLTKLEQQRRIQLEQHRSLLEEARNTIAFLKQVLEEKGIVYDINTLNALSKGMAGSKWSLMEELERRLLEILQDKSKSRQEMKEAIFAEVGQSVARLIEMEDEREKERSERATLLEEDNGSEDSEDNEKMDEMLRNLNERLDARGSTAAQGTPRRTKAKRKKNSRGATQTEDGAAAPPAANDDAEKQLAEKLRHKIAESLGQSKAEHFDTPLEWARFVQTSIDEWKRQVEEVKSKQPQKPSSPSVGDAAASVGTGDQSPPPLPATPYGPPATATTTPTQNGSSRQAGEDGRKKRKPRKKGKGRQSAQQQQQQPQQVSSPLRSRESSTAQQQHRAHANARQPEAAVPSGEAELLAQVGDIDAELSGSDEGEEGTTTSLATTTTKIVTGGQPRPKFSGAQSVDSKSRAARLRKAKLQRNLSLGEEMILSLTREEEERSQKEAQEKLGRLKERVRRLKDERAEWERERAAYAATKAAHAKLQVTLRKLREESNVKQQGLTDQLKAKEERLGATRRALEVKKKRIGELRQVAAQKEGRIRELTDQLATQADAQAALATNKEAEWRQQESQLQQQLAALTAQLESYQLSEARLAAEAAAGREEQDVAWKAREETLRAELQQLTAQLHEAQEATRTQLGAKEQLIADLTQRLSTIEESLRQRDEALAAKSGEAQQSQDIVGRLREELEAAEARLRAATSAGSQRQEEDEEERGHLEQQIKRLEDMLHSLIEEVDKKRMREEELLGELQKKDETIRELQHKIEQLEQLLNRQKQKRRVRQTHSLRLQRELVEAQQALEEQQRMADRLKQEMEQQEEDKRKELERVQREMEVKSKEELTKEMERMQREKESQRKELEKKHQQAGKAKDSELLAAFAAAAKEQVEMALTLAREAEALVGRMEDVDKKTTAAQSIQQLKDCSQEVMNCVEATSNDPSNLQMQQALMLKQRELGQAIQRVVIHTTAEGAAAKTELQKAVEAMASATGAGVGDGSKQLSDDANADNVTVMAAAQEAIQEIECAFALSSATGRPSTEGGGDSQQSEPVTLAGRILEKVKRFARLLKQVAAKTDDPKFKKEMLEYSNILPDRAIQLKIIAAVKSSSARDESSQLSSAAQGLKVSIQEALEILSVASLKKGLAATINQVSALKSLMSAWKNSNTLVFEV